MSSVYAATMLTPTAGAGSFLPNLARRLPVVEAFAPELRSRVLLLSCLTEPFADLWNSTRTSVPAGDGWSSTDARLARGDFDALEHDWQPAFGVRTDFARRRTLVEIDVLIAMGLGLNLSELQTLYRVQFPVLQQNEESTWYDRQGRIVFSVSKGLPGVGLPRTTPRGDPTPAWNDVRDMTSGTVERTILDDTQPGGPRERTIVYEAPFDRCDRERDYEIAWAHFERRFAKEGRSEA